MLSPRFAIGDVPERPVLAVLAAAIEASDAALRAEHPTLDHWPARDGDSPPTLVAADLLLSRLAELRALLDWYLAAIDAANRRCNDDPRSDDLF
jgi:hypothetical protein